jgi:subtilisin-like proprotein convertase family protein
MKTNLLLTGLLAVSVSVASASVYDYNFSGATTLNAAIPDGNPAGYATTIGVSGLGVGAGENDSVLDVSVALNLSGGYNGDLYGYLVNPTGQLVVLLNRIGQDGTHPFGNSGSGLNVTLADANTTLGNIHNASFGPVSGAYQADGGATLSGLAGNSGTGTWTLFLADLSGGDTSTLVSWGLEINVVPEPTTWALLIFGGIASAVVATKVYSQRTKTMRS